MGVGRAGVCGPLDVVSSYGPSVRRTLGVRVLSAGKLTQGGQTHTYYTVQVSATLLWLRAVWGAAFPLLALA